MGNSYPSKIGTKLDNSVCPDYRPDGRVRPGHLTGLQNRTSDTHSNAAKIACCMQRLPTLADRDDAGRQGSRTFADARPIGQMPPQRALSSAGRELPSEAGPGFRSEIRNPNKLGDNSCSERPKIAAIALAARWGHADQSPQFTLTTIMTGPDWRSILNIGGEYVMQIDAVGPVVGKCKRVFRGRYEDAGERKGSRMGSGAGYIAERRGSHGHLRRPFQEWTLRFETENARGLQSP